MSFSKTNCSKGHAPKYDCTDETFREVDGALRYVTNIPPHWIDNEKEEPMTSNEAIAARIEELEARLAQLEYDFYLPGGYTPAPTTPEQIEANRQFLDEKYSTSQAQRIELVNLQSCCCLADDGTVLNASAK